jgi:hypothetical protein
MLTIFERAPRPSRGAVLPGAVALGLILLAGLAQVPAGETPVKAAASPATVQIPYRSSLIGSGPAERSGSVLVLCSGRLIE